MKIKVSDYITKILVKNRITHVFGMSGGAAVHMFDSISKNKKINIISMTNEQFAAMAADGYARTTGRLGVAISTSGPGATNLLTGTCCSFYDSIPTLMITGQVSTNRQKQSKHLRQLGFQETETLAIFKSISKFCEKINHVNEIKFILEKAIYIAFDKRQGPVVVEIPDDIQRSYVETNNLISYKPKLNFNSKLDVEVFNKIISCVNNSQKPVIVLGNGIKTPKINQNLKTVLNYLKLPILTSWAGLDLIENKHPLNFGTFGVYGNRCGNFIIQNSDLLIVLGCRLSQNVTGSLYKSFAKKAKIILIDIDDAELKKFNKLGIKIFEKIHSPLNTFLYEFKSYLHQKKIKSFIKWINLISLWKKKLEEKSNKEIIFKKNYINVENFVRVLSDNIEPNSNIFVDTGANLTWTCNYFKIKKGHQIHSAWNYTPMGYSLPASIGAAFVNSKRNICIIGDGGLMLSLGELATVSRNKLDIKIFLFNNYGHGIQRQTINTWLKGNLVGVDQESGLAFPKNWLHLIKSFDINSLTINDNNELEKKLKLVLQKKGPFFINVLIDPKEPLHPFLKFGDSLDNQTPKLSNKELKYYKTN